MSNRRISRELKDLQKDPPPGISAAPIDNNLYHWEGCIIGPDDSPYAYGIFKLEIFFPSDYPYKPMKVKFKTKIFHPNISPAGNICLSTLKDEDWTPALTISHVLFSILSLLTDPNPDDPLVPEVARLYNTNIYEFNRQASDWTLKYAI